MAGSKKEIEIYHDDYVNSIKRNIEIVGQQLLAQKKVSLTPANVEKFAAHGLGVKIISSLYGENSIAISQDPELMAAFEKGRSNISSRIRASIVNDALVNDIPQAKFYLDKIYNKEEHSQDINLTVTQSPLKDISDEQLLQIDLDESETK